MSKLIFNYDFEVRRETERHKNRIKTIEEAKKFSEAMNELIVFDDWAVEVCPVSSQTINLHKGGSVGIVEFRTVLAMAEKITGEKSFTKSSYNTGEAIRAFACIYLDGFTIDVQSGVDQSSCKIITETETSTRRSLSPECFDPQGNNNAIQPN